MADSKPNPLSDNRTNRKMRLLRFYLEQGGRLGPFIVLLLAAAFTWQASLQPLGSLQQPGPGMWPLAIGILTMLLALLAMIFIPEIPQVLRRSGLFRVSVYTVGLALIIPIYDVAGFIPAAGFFCLVLLKIIGRESWTLSIILAVAAPSIVYAIFGIFLELPLIPWF